MAATILGGLLTILLAYFFVELKKYLFPKRRKRVRVKKTKKMETKDE